MPIDSVVRLRQLHQPEVSGYVVSILQSYISSGAVTGIAGNTGQLTGVFYPRQSNPSGFINSGQLTGYALKTDVSGNNNILLTTVSSLYYPLTNPSGFVATTDSNYVKYNNYNSETNLALTDVIKGINFLDYHINDYFNLNGDQNSSIKFFNNPIITGFTINSPAITTTLLNGQSVLTPSNVTNLCVPWRMFSSTGTVDGFSFFVASDVTNFGAIYFNPAVTGFWLQGQRKGFPSENYVIDFYGTKTNVGVPTGKPYIKGFDIYGGVVQSSGSNVVTYANASEVVMPWIISASGVLHTDDVRNLARCVQLTGSQSITGVKTFVTSIETPRIDLGLPNHFPGIFLTSGKIYHPTDHNVSIDYLNYNLNVYNQTRLNWESGILSRWQTGSVAPTLDWTKRILSGNWDAGGLTINGQPIVNTLGIVYTTGDQLIFGSKIFNSEITVPSIHGNNIDISLTDPFCGVQGAQQIIDFSNRKLIDVYGNSALIWSNRTL
jgi:hypothetical protein